MIATWQYRRVLLAVALVLVASTGAHARTPDLSLRLAEFVFDPADGEPRLPAGWDRSSTVGPDLHLVQFDGPVTDQRLERLRAKGLEPVRYVYPNAYIVWGRTDDRLTLNGEPSVRWTGDFAPAYRVQPQWRSLDGTVDARVLLVRDAGIEATIASIERLGGVPGGRFAVNDKIEVASFSLPAGRMQAVATIPGVYSIQVAPTDWGSRAEVSAQLNAGNLDGANMPIPGYPAWLAGLGLDGSGVLVGHVDEGFDELHPDLVARVAPCAGSTCSATGSPHGTHTAGIIAADATSGVLDGNGFLRGQGVAPGAGLIEQVYFPTLLEPGGMLELMRQSRANGAALSNNSWGRSTLTWGYDVHALLVDTGVRDADPDTPGNQPLIYVQALDNGNGGTSTQGVPDDAKNIFTVGATRALGLDANPDPNYNDLSDVTAHGPALDGRTIPHIVAPGCRVDSTLPSGGGFDHGTRCGTSMAAANVSGAVALFVEYYRGLAGTTGDPSPALVKSAFLPVAHDLEGFLDADGGTLGHRPDSKQGWGRLDLAAVVDPAPGSVLYFDQTNIFDFTGQEWMRVVTPVDPGQPMRIMLTWTDAPGHGLGGSTPAWNNDLDLVVEVGVDTYLGNVIGVDGFSATGGAADTMNNTEGVFLQGLTAGTEIALRVSAANINSDGVPNHGDGTDQDFALTCYNCALAPGFALTAAPAVLDLCAPADGTYVIDAEQIAGYNESITLSVVDAPAGANAGFDTNPVVPGGSSTLTITDTASAAAGDYTLQVRGDTIDLSRSIPILFNVRSGMPAPASLTLPIDSAQDVELQPVLEWDPVPWTSHYLVEVTTDPTFDTIVYHAVSQGPSHRVRIVLNQMVSYYWRVRATNACGFGDFSLSRTFETRDVPSLLLVDDDWDLPNVQHEYTMGLDRLLVPYDLWDVFAVEGGNEPDAATLARYDKVIWFSGQEEVLAGPEPETEQALEGWLDRSGCLMVSSADYVLNSDFSAFIQERLGVASVNEDTGQNTVTGQGVFGGLGPWSLQNINPDYSDSMTPDATAEIAFVGDMGTAAVDKDTGFYRTVFAGYGLERLPGSPDNLVLVLDTFLNWCEALPGLDGDLDGVSNDADCVAGDPDVWTAPSPITDLMLGRSMFSWSQPVSGSGAVYDVLRSIDNTDFYNATCVATGVSNTTALADINDPGPGEMFFYLVGARNECGLSTLGQNPDGTPRYGTACE